MKNYWNFIAFVYFGVMITGSASAQIQGTFLDADFENTTTLDGEPFVLGNNTGWEFFPATSSSSSHILTGGIFGDNTDGLTPTGGYRLTNPNDPDIVSTFSGPDIQAGEQYNVDLILQYPIFNTSQPFVFAGTTANPTFRLPARLQVVAEGGVDLTEAPLSTIYNAFSLPLGTVTANSAGEIQLFITNNIPANSQTIAYNGIAITAADETLVGDFDGNEVVDCDDLDGYVGNIGAAATGDLATLDLDGSGFLEVSDATTHVTTLVVTSNGVTGTFLGDLNCDGSVSVLGDAFTLVGNLGGSATMYSQGDLNFDGTVTVLGDAFTLVGNLGLSNTQ